MKSYQQFCPVAKAAEVFCERWTPLVVRELAAGATRFSDIHRGVPQMSPTLLSDRLKRLEAEGIVERRPAKGSRGSTYHLTESGMDFVPLVDALGVWGQRWTRRQLAEVEQDLGLLLWTMESGAKAAAFGPERTVVRLELTDQPPRNRFWWYVNQGGRCGLCHKDPGFEVDLYLAGSLPVMIYIVRGDLRPARAAEAGKFEVIGTAKARQALDSWLDISPYAAVPSRRSDAQADYWR